MATQIKQLISADRWFAVFARPSGAAREHHGAGGQRPVPGARAGGPVPEFVPLLAWALVVDDAGAEADRVVGMIVTENRHAEAILPDDPSFLGYAGPGDAGIEPGGFAPDWRAQARQRIDQLKHSNDAAGATAR
jgi:hypothetical protein